MKTCKNTTVLVIGANAYDRPKLKEVFYLSETHNAFFDCNVDGLNLLLRDMNIRNTLLNEPIIILINGECVSAEFILKAIRKNKYTKFTPVFVYGEINSYSKINEFKNYGADHCFRKYDNWPLITEVICDVWVKAQIAYSF